MHVGAFWRSVRLQKSQHLTDLVIITGHELSH